MGWTTKTEHRKDRRVSAQMPLRFSVIGPAGQASEIQRTTTTNVSCQGLAFESDQAIPITARLGLEILLPGEMGELKAEAVLMRIARELPDRQGVEYGVQFDMNTCSDPDLLAQYVRSIDIVPLLELMTRQGASDLHLTAFTQPMFRLHKKLIPAGDEPLSPATVEGLVCGTLNAERRAVLLREKDLDYVLILPELGRWRINAFFQRGFIEATFHAIDLYVPTPSELGLPEVVRNLALGQSGLVIVSGPVGSGKSTTLAGMVGVINNEQERAVTTLESPIEYIHENDRSIVKQREINRDTGPVTIALRQALRQDPDVVVIDCEPDAIVVETAMRAAETGYLVLLSLPTPDAVTTLNRVVSMFTDQRRFNTLHNLAASVRGIISQRLLPSADGGVVAACEVMALNRLHAQLDTHGQARPVARADGELAGVADARREFAQSDSSAA